MEVQRPPRGRDDIAFPVLRRHGMRVKWNRKQSRRIRITGARWYAPTD
ncbi:hypothetical protein [Micromonospora tarensis]|uniref:Uncharacterized protein n=1 Tax=Micromonospora tarensis TaxID=2806100 RepID=A0ABS1YGI6_9ACTN|nr:hypothetical protein [Micromonospora tarensis]MBM0276520.1 hypothetical protein [Micromonospora tarensis]